MCGIAAMLGGVDSSTLGKMVGLLEHRGPDGNDIWVDDEIGLGHSRLAIVDINGSDQPIHSEHGSVLVVNGEIYNHKDTRAELKNYPWKTKGDSESILALQQQSNDWVSRLDGIFAICLWNAKRQELILARDPLGVKPLLRTVVDGTLLVSSEAKALRAHESYQPKMDITALQQRIAFEYPLDNATLFEGVEQVAPGTEEVWGLQDGKAVLLRRKKYKQYNITPKKDYSTKRRSWKFVSRDEVKCID